ncbi:hypothetical protein BLA29_004819 [Euroglyphus maynei]|uniref:Uncharacterized protein n=1 Tax=Euroglyphus maynei TaxID=6958 RepID=A0A1Y3BU25_EURMA|nr:hypothetical protein BLA29_004819 [Euroglyphus maynei]
MSAISLIQSLNQWSSEEQFCENLLQPCQCFVDAQTNLLSVHCKGDDRIDDLNQILIRIAQTTDNIQFDELIVENFTQISAMNFGQIQQVPIKTIRIFNCDHMKRLVNENPNPNSTLAQSLLEIELAGNIAIESDQLFEFLYTFSHLRSIILSSINYQRIPVFNRHNECLPWNRLVFNHRCTNQKQQAPLSINRTDQFINLCNMEWLDLSCMNVQYINRMAILKLCQHLNTTTSSSQLHLDLSYNPLLNIEQWINGDYDERIWK